MKNHRFISMAAVLGMLVLIHSLELRSQYKSLANDVMFDEQNLGGPRLGVTYVAGNGKLGQALDERGWGRTLSQFGWHFEYQVVPDGGGPAFVIQFVPLIGGVEFGKLIPSGTLAMGVRMPEGIEFGMGPNAVITEENGKTSLASALVMTIGKSFTYGGVNIPLNLVYAKNPDGDRFSIIFGYAIRKANK
jgi:hypothetical protein